jgi:hypothetical protein
MAYLVALCLLVGAGVDQAPSETLFVGAAHDEAADRAQELFDSIGQDIKKWSGDPDMRDRLAQTLATRGWLHINREELQKALHDFDAALAIDPPAGLRPAGAA